MAMQSWLGRRFSLEAQQIEPQRAPRFSEEPCLSYVNADALQPVHEPLHPVLHQEYMKVKEQTNFASR